jgi:hypothetical protein
VFENVFVAQQKLYNELMNFYHNLYKYYAIGNYYKSIIFRVLVKKHKEETELSEFNMWP